MASPGSAVYGLYKNREQVEEAVNTLRAAGFGKRDISVLFPDTGVSKELADQKGTKPPQEAAEGAAGGGSGSVVGGALGWLAGIGALSIPGAGPFIAAGPIVGALAGAVVGGSVGWIAGALIGLGMPEHEAKLYESRLKEGHILLSVHLNNPQMMRKARVLLESSGAKATGSKGEAKAA